MKLLELCENHTDVFVTAGNGVVEGISMEVDEQFATELRAANVSTVRCNRPGIRLHVGGGVEGTVDFEAAYIYDSGDHADVPDCEPSIFVESPEGYCFTRLVDSWYIYILWFDINEIDG